jgi:hypothetical protein
LSFPEVIDALLDNGIADQLLRHLQVGTFAVRERALDVFIALTAQSSQEQIRAFAHGELIAALLQLLDGAAEDTAIRLLECIRQIVGAVVQVGNSIADAFADRAIEALDALIASERRDLGEAAAALRDAVAEMA